MKLFSLFRYPVVPLIFLAVASALSQPVKRQQILIVFEGADVPANLGRGDARQLAMLLGHFDVDYKLEGMQAYKPNDVNLYDHTFFIGFSKKYDPPDKFLRDVYTTRKPVVWMNTGFDRYCERFDVKGKFGFKFISFDTVSNFDVVTSGDKKFTKGEPNLNIIGISDKDKVEVLATAHSTSKKREEPYILQGGNFMYIADSPFASADETDRYLLFADMLHDILGEPHQEIHRAMLRIEDVDVFEDPGRLRDIADALYAKNIPFLVGIIPFFVDPGQGIRVSLSDKPEFVDAIHYMVSRGATIVMHGITHQYQGVTATDYEFWDASTDKPIRNDSKENVEKRMRMGLEECWKNNIYPLIWETPHYTASQIDYPVFGEFFSTCMEQRLVIDNIDYSQYYPYIIDHDLYGQRILPENLGYIPFDSLPQVEEDAVQHLLKGAQAELNVRDGFASAFIHPFVDLKYILEYVDGVQDLGYTFYNAKEEAVLVHVKDRVVATGSQTFPITLEDQYLRELWLKPEGDIDRQVISQTRVNGLIEKHVDVPFREIYIAEPSEFRTANLTTFERVTRRIQRMFDNLSSPEETFAELKPAIRWDPAAKGNNLNDQASFASAIRSLNVPLDTLETDSIPPLDKYNLVVIPYNTVERLSNRDYDRLIDYVESGGNVITDGKNDLAEELGVRFASSSLKIERMRDQLYPEDPLTLRVPETMRRYEVDRNDELFCNDERTEAAVVIGRQRKAGKFLYFGLRFDPSSTGGYTRFPYIMEYVQRYFHLRPVLKREHLEMYFDPGYRRNISIEDLVKRWVTEGVRIIHAAGWHQYPNGYLYDYKRLIQLCHANGILVYAWLEPPMVSLKFWTDHPEWREVNYRGDQIPPMWRYIMSLTSPQCLQAVKDVYRDFLQTYDWDGVNFAELYFESPTGPADAKTLIPMHPSARMEFKHKYGFDPAMLVDSTSEYFWRKNPDAWKKFEEYRVETIVRLHDELLTLADAVKASKPYLDIVVTTFDNLNNPELRTDLGVDVMRILALQQRHSFSLQVEDPQTQWSKDPRRYQHLGNQYAALVGNKTPLMLDLNIFQLRTELKPTIFPTLVQTGIESYQLIRSAAFGSDRFTIYSEATARPQDLRMFSYAASARSTIRTMGDSWSIDTPLPVVLDLPADYIDVRLPQGDRIYSDNGSYYLPAGQYTVIGERKGSTPFPATLPGGTLLSLTGKLMDLKTSTRSVTFSYESRLRCIACFNHPPFTVIVDGKEIPFQTVQGYRRFSVMLPPGDHEVIAVLETTVSYGVDITSFWSSWLIVIFGVISSAALLTFYALVRVSRPGNTTV
jgi:uncharacterized protein YdaL